MLRFCFFITIYLIGYSSVWAQGTIHNEPTCKEILSIVASESSAAKSKIAMHGLLKKSISNNFDIVYNRCEWTIDPKKNWISGNVLTTFKALSTLSSVRLDLNDALKVLSVTKGKTLLAYKHKDNVLQIELSSTLLQGALDSVVIQYEGAPISTGLGSFFQTNHAGVPVVWTLSEPYGAKDWWPCSNNLGDKIDSVDIWINCPKNNIGVSNGIKIADYYSSDSVWHTTHWQHRYPIASYLLCMAVTNYAEFSQKIELGSRSLLMQSFCYPESKDEFEKGTYAAVEAMQLFHYLFGDYPFINEKYGHTQFSWGGGMEHQTNSFMVNVNPSLSAHELAHQWFGDKITCGSWQDIWLNEGFATHLASIYMESKQPESTLIWRKNEIEKICNAKDGSVRVDDTTNVGRIFDSRLSYLKGSHLLYMLRFKLGDVVFFNAIRQYQKDSALQYGFSKTADLKRHLEVKSGQNLDSFFRQWYEGQGYPSYHIDWVQTTTNWVKLRVNQTSSHSSVSFFQMPIALKFKNASQEKTIIIDPKYNGAIFAEQIDFLADTVLFDPDFWLISANNSSRKLDDLDTNQPNVLLYPNPAKNVVFFECKNFKGENISIKIFDATGKKVIQNFQDLYQGRCFKSINISALAPGIYKVSVLNNLGTNNVLSLQVP